MNNPTITDYINGSTCFLIKDLLEKWLKSNEAKQFTFNPWSAEDIQNAYDHIGEVEAALRALEIFTRATEGESPIVKLNNNYL